MALLAYAAEGDLNGVRQELNNGAQIDYRGGWMKSTALMCGVDNGQVEIVKHLIHAKADTNLMDGIGDSALLVAARNERDEKHNIHMVKALCEEGKAYVEARDSMGKTPLINAAENGHIDIVTYLVERAKADVHARDKSMKSAADWALKSKNEKVLKYLRKDANKELHDGQPEEDEASTPIKKHAFRTSKVKGPKQIDVFGGQFHEYERRRSNKRGACSGCAGGNAQCIVQ